MRLLVLALLGTLQFSTSIAQGSALPSFENFLGISRVFNNDVIGDGHDRWRTGSYDVSLTFGPAVEEGLPDRPGQVMQYRLRSEIVAPDDLSSAIAFPDRPYAGIIGLGAFTHYQRGGVNISFGAELVMTGPSTQLGDFQTWIHDGLGIQAPQMLATQLPNHIYPTVQAEVSRDIRRGNTLFRPFAEAQAGFESYARVGVDTIIGPGLSQNFFVRDPITGHLLTNVRRNQQSGFGFLLGGDVAYVAGSSLLPASAGYDVREFRPRVRAGVVYEAEKTALFYGLTWLGREFEAQSESQVTGSLHVKINF